MMKTATEVHDGVQAAAMQASPATRVVEAMLPGQAIRQGDIYLIRLAAIPPNLPPVAPGRQLAPGTTRGSRHCVDGSVSLYEIPGAGRLDGPLVVATERFRVTHPEHAHFSLPPGAYQVRYQRNFAVESIERVMD